MNTMYHLDCPGLWLGTWRRRGGRLAWRFWQGGGRWWRVHPCLFLVARDWSWLGDPRVWRKERTKGISFLHPISLLSWQHQWPAVVKIMERQLSWLVHNARNLTKNLCNNQQWGWVNGSVIFFHFLLDQYCLLITAGISLRWVNQIPSILPDIETFFSAPRKMSRLNVMICGRMWTTQILLCSFGLRLLATWLMLQQTTK